MIPINITPHHVFFPTTRRVFSIGIDLPLIDTNFYTQYQKDAARTNANLKSASANLIHMVVGMCSEMNELEDALKSKDKVNLGEEIADIFWYISNFCTITNESFESIYRYGKFLSCDQKPSILNKFFGRYKTKKVVGDLYYNISILQDVVKKHFVYGKELSDTSNLLASIVLNLISISILEGIDIPKNLSKNIEKLRQRFPDKFTENDAINRDTEKERQILES